MKVIIYFLHKEPGDKYLRRIIDINSESDYDKINGITREDVHYEIIPGKKDSLKLISDVNILIRNTQTMDSIQAIDFLLAMIKGSREYYAKVLR